MAEDLVTVELKCDGRSCGRDAVVYCTVCKQLFCETHQEFHDGFMSSLSSPHQVKSVEEYRRQIREENSRLCDIHKQSVIAGCQFCYKPICLKCLDDQTQNSTCPTDGQDKHSSRSADEVSLKIQREMKEMLSELLVKQLTHADKIKQRRKTYDDVMEENRTDLDKLSVKVQQLHKKLDEFADEIRDGMVAHMKLKEEIMKKCESDYSEYQKNCKEIHDQTSDFFKLENEIVLKNQQMMRDKLEPLKSLQLEHQPFPPKLFIEFREDEHFKIPIQLINTDGVPKSLEHKTTVDAEGIRAVQYLHDGRLIYAGDESLLAGLDFTPDIPGGGNIIFLCEHKDKLYVLQYLQSDKNLHVHIINLKDQSVQPSVLRCAGSNSHQQIAVNRKYIIFTAGTYEAPTVRIFSTQNFSPSLELKPESVKLRWIWGKEFLYDSLVIGDWNNGKVYNVTICSPSTVKWTCSITSPTAIRVCSQVILVGSNSKQIHMLSRQGVKLSTIDAPQTYDRVTDLYRFSNQLATVDGSNQLHVYEITDED